jgi:hypothetical protein
MELSLYLLNFCVNTCDCNKVKWFFKNLEKLEEEPEFAEYLESLWLLNIQMLIDF